MDLRAPRLLQSRKLRHAARGGDLESFGGYAAVIRDRETAGRVICTLLAMKVERVAKQYDRLARRYEARWQHYVQASVRETLARVDLRPGVRLLDIGCGTGALLREVAQRAPDVPAVGIDVSHQMLGVARADLASPSRLLQADVHRLPLQEGTFDVVVSSSSFHYWPDPYVALGQIAGVLRPGGQLVITDWCDDFLACRVCDRLLRLLSRTHQRIYTARECDALLREAGYEVKKVDRYKIDWLWGLMTASALRPYPGVVSSC